MSAAAQVAGLPREALEVLARAHRTAMIPREPERGLLTSDRDPSYLHPGRTVLILLTDLGERAPGILIAGALAESREPELRVPDEWVEERVFGEDLWEGEEWIGSWREWAALPDPGWGRTEAGVDSDAGFLAALLDASAPVGRGALAEGLDQLRHAHLWRSNAARRRALELAERVWLPAASRLHPVLERRLAWWVRRVGPGIRKGSSGPGSGGGG